MHKFNRLTLRLKTESAQKELRSFLADKVLDRMKVCWVVTTLGGTIPAICNLWLGYPGSKTHMVFIAALNLLFLLAFVTKHSAKTDFFVHTFGASIVLMIGVIMNLMANDMLFDEPSVKDCSDSVLNLETWLMIGIYSAYILLSTDFLHNSIWVSLIYIATSIFWRVAREECFEGKSPDLFYAEMIFILAVMMLGHYAQHLTYTEMFVMYHKSNSQNE